MRVVGVSRQGELTGNKTRRGLEPTFANFRHLFPTQTQRLRQGFPSPLPSPHNPPRAENKQQGIPVM